MTFTEFAASEPAADHRVVAVPGTNQRDQEAQEIVRNQGDAGKRGRGSKPIKDARNQELARSIPSIQLTRPPMRRPYFSLIVRLISVPQLSQM